MKVKMLKLLIFLVLTSSSMYAQLKKEGVQVFLNAAGLEHASIGICVKDISGKDIISYNADKLYTPASILKVVTTATAIEILGAEYRYETTLAKDRNQKNRLLIHGYGDPTLGTQYLDNVPNAFVSQWADRIKQSFGPTENIDITVIDDYFGYKGISDRWIYQDMGNYYAAGSYGISVYDNTYQLFFNTMRRDTCPIIVKTDPKMKLNFRNTMKLNTSGQDNGYIHGVPFSSDRLLTGDIPAGRTAFSIKGDIPNPGLYLGQVLADQLSNVGYSIGEVENTYDRYFKNMYLREKESFTEDIFYRHLSFPLKDIIKDTNFRSDNHFAEHLIRTIGRVEEPDIYSSSLDAGIDKTISFWKSKGLNATALTIFDGSGLAPSNAVSPAFMCDLLMYMKTNSKYSQDFLESLPKAGFDGTVKSRLKDTRLAGKISMKSGSIYGVQCFAGYYIDGNKTYAFTIMVNKFTGQRSQIVKAIDKLLLSIF